MSRSTSAKFLLLAIENKPMSVPELNKLTGLSASTIKRTFYSVRDKIYVERYDKSSPVYALKTREDQVDAKPGSYGLKQVETLLEMFESGEKMTYTEIAEKFNVSISWVTNMVSQIRDKLYIWDWVSTGVKGDRLVLVLAYKDEPGLVDAPYPTKTEVKVIVDREAASNKRREEEERKRKLEDISIAKFHERNANSLFTVWNPNISNRED